MKKDQIPGHVNAMLDYSELDATLRQMKRSQAEDCILIDRGMVRKPSSHNPEAKST